MQISEDGGINAPKKLKIKTKQKLADLFVGYETQNLKNQNFKFTSAVDMSSSYSDLLYNTTTLRPVFHANPILGHKI